MFNWIQSKLSLENQTEMQISWLHIYKEHNMFGGIQESSNMVKDIASLFQKYQLKKI